MMANRKSIGSSLFLATISLIAVALILESVLRLTGLQGDFFFQLDEQVGAIHIPGKKGHNVFQGRQIPIEINSYGYRDEEWSRPKPPGVSRIGVLGDSFIEGFQVQSHELLTSVLEQLLNVQCQGSPIIEVLNFGNSGFGTAEEYETFRHRAIPLDPDYVLLFFYPSNDLFDNSSELGVEAAGLYYFLDDDGNLQRSRFELVDPPYKKWLRKHSRAYLFVRDRIKRVEALRRALIKARLVRGGAPTEGRTGEAVEILQNSQYLQDLPPEIERAWDVTEALLAELQHEVEMAGAWFGVIVIPNRQEVVNEGPPEDGRTESGINYRQSLDKISQITDRLEIPLLHLVDPTTESGLRLDEIYYLDDGHWTPSGHRIAAEATAEWLREEVCSSHQ